MPKPPPPGQFNCCGCRKTKGLHLQSPTKKGLCAACHELLKAQGVRIHGNKASLPCPTPGCTNVRTVTLAYRLSRGFNPVSTCVQCSDQRQRAARSERMTELAAPKRAVVGRDPGCTIPRRKRECRKCRDLKACIEAKL